MTMSPDSLPVGFRDVDSTQPDKILRCLDTLATLDAVRAYKEAALGHLGLGAGSVALDVACGRGDDVARMQALGARAVGSDRSKTLLELAKGRHPGCEFRQADAAAMPFAD